MTLVLNLQDQRDSGTLVLNLALAGSASTATGAGRTRTTGQAGLEKVGSATLAGRTCTTGQAGLEQVRLATLAGRTAGCRGHGVATYDPNLLSEWIAQRAGGWRDDAPAGHAAAGTWAAAPLLEFASAPGWAEGQRIAGTAAAPWRSSDSRQHGTASGWAEAPPQRGDAASRWKDSLRLERDRGATWREAEARSASADSLYRARLRLWSPAPRLPWADGVILAATWIARSGDGIRQAVAWSTRWNDAGLAYNAWLPPWIPPPPRPRPPRPLVLNLHRWRAPGPLILNLGPDRAWWDIADRRTYRVLNSVSVVRLPDRAELPVTALTVETDADSWGWQVSLTLVGATGWTLCQPGSNGLPREVEITVNGTVWTAMLDDPQLTRAFNSHRISAKGTSRSGWLTSPYAPSMTVRYDAPRSAQQIAEEILDGTGWALDWQLPDDPQWLVPANHYAHTGNPLDRLKALVAAVKGCLYSDPDGYGFTAYPRYPVLPWDWDEAQVDVAIPEAALLSWNQQAQARPSVNRVYVSGTTAGVLLQLTRDGTAGDLCASEPIVEALLTDVYAARARAEAELAGGGPGTQVTVETLLGGSENIPLVRPGQLCEFAGIRGVVRACSLSASRSGEGLAVRQSLTLERRLGPWV